MSEYKERDAMQLDEAGNYYGKHVVAMTSESLHSKSDIAAELGYRDMVIDAITKQRDELELAMNELLKGLSIYKSIDTDHMVGAPMRRLLDNAIAAVSTIKEQKDAGRN